MLKSFQNTCNYWFHVKSSTLYILKHVTHNFVICQGLFSLNLGNRFWFCVLYRQLEHGCEFSRIKIWARRPHASNSISILTCFFNSFQKKIKDKRNSFSGIKAFCQLRPMLGYSSFLPKFISYDVKFYCFIKIRLPKTIFQVRKGHNHRETKKFAISNGIRRTVTTFYFYRK